MFCSYHLILEKDPLEPLKVMLAKLNVLAVIFKISPCYIKPRYKVGNLDHFPIQKQQRLE